MDATSQNGLLETTSLPMDENLPPRNCSAHEMIMYLAKRKREHEKLHPESRHGGRRIAGQTRNGHKSFIDDMAEKVGLHRDSIGKLARIGSRLVPLPANLNGHSIRNNKRELDLLSRQTPDVQKDIVDKLVSGDVQTVTEAVTGRNGRNGHNGADPRCVETEVPPNDSRNAADGPESQVGAPPSCSVKPDEGEEAPVAASDQPELPNLPTDADNLETKDRTVLAGSNGHGNIGLSIDSHRGSTTLRSQIDTGVEYIQRLVDALEGPKKVVDELSDQLNAMYTAYVGRNGRERPALPPIRSSTPRTWSFPQPDSGPNVAKCSDVWPV